MRGLGIWIGAALVATFAAAQAPGGWLSLSGPREGQLSLVGPVAVELQLRPPARKSSLELRVDGVAFPVDGFELRGRTMRGVIEGLGAVRHTFVVSVAGKRGKHGNDSLSSWFELVELENPEQCEVLNNASCLLPFLSSRFLPTTTV